MRMLEICKKCKKFKWKFADLMRGNECWKFKKNKHNLYDAVGKNVNLVFLCEQSDGGFSNTHCDENAYITFDLPRECEFKMEQQIMMQEFDGSIEWK